MPESAGDTGTSIDNRRLLLGWCRAGPRNGRGSSFRHWRLPSDSGGPEHTDGLGTLAGGLADTGAQVFIIVAGASDPEALRARMAQLYDVLDAPGLLIYNAVMGAPDGPRSPSVEHLQTAFAVDVISAIGSSMQVAAPVMRGSRLRHHHGDGWRLLARPDPSPGQPFPSAKPPFDSAATMLGADLEPDGIRRATLTIAGQIVAGTAFDPENIAERYWEVVHS